MSVNLTHVLLWVCLANLSTAQLNGEFWWLNEKFKNYTNAQPSQPKYEELSEFDNDENTKIVFRDDNLLANKVIRVDPEASRQEKDFKYNKVIVWPTDNENNFSDEKSHFTKETFQVKESEGAKITNHVFKFPKTNYDGWSDQYSTQNLSDDNNYNSIIAYRDLIKFVNNVAEEADLSKFQSYCTYMKKKECYLNNGFITRTQFGQKLYTNAQLVCCIFDQEPKKDKDKDTPSKIHFPDNIPQERRLKRSNNEGHKLDQRKILLQRRKATQEHNSKTTMAPKISSVDYEYDDPYWNIKTPTRNDNKKEHINRYDYDAANDYTGDYTVEVPRPGLLGIYSDYPQKPVDSPNKDNEYYDDGVVYDDVDDDEAGFGYSTVDPRKIIKTMAMKRDQKENPHDPESQTISYYSKPDFNVLQGFKLKLFNKVLPSKHSRKSTAIESILDGNVDEEEGVIKQEGDRDLEYPVFPDCGHAVQTVEIEQNAQRGEALNGSHPWLALVTPSDNKKTVLCYATLVHPRAAITAAHCVFKKSPGEITVIAGIQDSNEIMRGKSRVPSIRIHPNYKPGNLSNDMALLHWNRSFELETNIQPACLASPHFGHNCLFYGWGGFDQVGAGDFEKKGGVFIDECYISPSNCPVQQNAIRQRSRWQKAIVRSCKVSVSLKNGRDLPDDAFCATVRGRGTVTGIGGSLICPTERTMAAVGVAVHRDTTVVLLPIRPWVIVAIESLKLNT